MFWSYLLIEVFFIFNLCNLKKRISCFLLFYPTVLFLFFKVFFVEFCKNISAVFVV